MAFCNRQICKFYPMNTREDLKEKVSMLPNSPGVYLYYDK